MIPTTICWPTPSVWQMGDEWNNGIAQTFLHHPVKVVLGMVAERMVAPIADFDL
jgi:hypothetical protein